MLSEKDINLILKNDFFPPDFEGKTNFLIFEILYQTGIRRSELINLKEGDIDKSSAAIKVLGKGNKERIIPVNNQLIIAIEAYISEKRRQFPELTIGNLLISKKGETPESEMRIYYCKK